MFTEPKPYISFKHISAASPEDLELEMLKISVQSQHSPSFTPPTFSNNKWHTWFMYDFAQDVKGKDKLALENK